MDNGAPVISRQTTPSLRWFNHAASRLIRSLPPLRKGTHAKLLATVQRLLLQRNQKLRKTNKNGNGHRAQANLLCFDSDSGDQQFDMTAMRDGLTFRTKSPLFTSALPLVVSARTRNQTIAVGRGDVTPPNSMSNTFFSEVHPMWQPSICGTNWCALTGETYEDVLRHWTYIKDKYPHTGKSNSESRSLHQPTSIGFTQMQIFEYSLTDGDWERNLLKLNELRLEEGSTADTLDGKMVVDDDDVVDINSPATISSIVNESCGKMEIIKVRPRFLRQSMIMLGCDPSRSFELGGIMLHKSRIRNILNPEKEFQMHSGMIVGDLPIKPVEVESHHSTCIARVQVPTDQTIMVADLVAICREAFPLWNIHYNPDLSPFCVLERICGHEFHQKFWDSPDLTTTEQHRRTMKRKDGQRDVNESSLSTDDSKLTSYSTAGEEAERPSGKSERSLTTGSVLHEPVIDEEEQQSRIKLTSRSNLLFYRDSDVTELADFMPYNHFDFLRGLPKPKNLLLRIEHAKHLKYQRPCLVEPEVSRGVKFSCKNKRRALPFPPIFPDAVRGRTKRYFWDDGFIKASVSGKIKNSFCGTVFSESEKRALVKLRSRVPHSSIPENSADSLTSLQHLLWRMRFQEEALRPSMELYCQYLHDVKKRKRRIEIKKQKASLSKKKNETNESTETDDIGQMPRLTLTQGMAMSAAVTVMIAPQEVILKGGRDQTAESVDIAWQWFFPLVKRFTMNAHETAHILSTLQSTTGRPFSHHAKYKNHKLQS
eukprot:GHVH01011330.1.p1 GENE.GHVH01011330.1~~GHVH01011330.1.p1  ORF type:complete len:766 (+),score=97.12 GHVH01011330.1:922-3219(+)